MAISKMSMVNNSYRYFTIAVDGYENRCMRGIIYHGKTPGFRFGSLLEMALDMDYIFNKMDCPKQTMEMRTFEGVEYPKPVIRNCVDEDQIRSGKLATFQIYVKYRYNASWQGEITWLETDEVKSFQSYLELVKIMDRILSGSEEMGEHGEAVNVCQVAIDSFGNGAIEGSVQNPLQNNFHGFFGLVDMAESLEKTIEMGISDGSENRTEDSKVNFDEDWNTYRKGGRNATFVIRVRFREYSTLQGEIYWREGKLQQSFRSFFEMLILMASAIGSTEP
jgi:hypothetical protein